MTPSQVVVQDLLPTFYQFGPNRIEHDVLHRGFEVLRIT
jgi:hypothetical protein